MPFSPTPGANRFLKAILIFFGLLGILFYSTEATLFALGGVLAGAWVKR